jgi:hypothetical protein
MSITNIEEHIPTPRKIYNKKPTLLIISGESMVGKTTLSFLLRDVKKSYYVSLDQLTLDVNLPIKSINDLVSKFGNDFSARSIFYFCEHVFRNKIIFIEYCFNLILNKKQELFIFDGVYFTNEEFLNEFIKKFEDTYHIWIVNRPTKK